ncbi:hypothetical protein BGZ61DRAFT_449654 [Ilyonectria robusta]|uniref:uncharacterized protein n=1 Tax=Ilyonectria robusta TaxID=1079257 RepID=UPI001E8E8A88|nr:uncharacterized protein BGZ61DRAFT_449654 [Ilyonectria robusta]KAH8706279.1 hypothetical protein BGZ61DRAFT_449654 [Ilyonectria robusta]
MPRNQTAGLRRFGSMPKTFTSGRNPTPVLQRRLHRTVSPPSQVCPVPGVPRRDSRVFRHSP